MTEPISQETKWNALTTIVKRLPAQLTYYTSALGAIVLAGGGQLPPGLEFVAGGIGANLLSNLIDEVARGKTLPEGELSSQVEEAVQKSDIANLLTHLNEISDAIEKFEKTIALTDAQLLKTDRHVDSMYSQALAYLGLTLSYQDTEKHYLLKAEKAYKKAFENCSAAGVLDRAELLLHQIAGSDTGDFTGQILDLLQTHRANN